MSHFITERIGSIDQKSSPSLQGNGQWKVADEYEFPASGFSGIPVATLSEGQLAMVDTDTNWSQGYRLVRQTNSGIWDPATGPGRMTFHLILGADAEDNGVEEAAPVDFTTVYNNARAVDNSKVAYINTEIGVTAKEYNDTPTVSISDNVYNAGVYHNHGLTNAKESFGWGGIEAKPALGQFTIYSPGMYLFTLKYRLTDLAAEDTDCEEVIVDSPTTGTKFCHMAAQSGGSSITTSEGTRYPSSRTACWTRWISRDDPAFTLRLRTRIATALTAQSTPTRHILFTITRIAPGAIQDGNENAAGTSLF